MDVVALAQAGFGNAVATLGTACTAEHVQKLVRFTDSVVFSFDGDAAGRRAAGRALEASLPHASDTRSFRFLFLPAEHDPDSFVRELGAEAFEQRVGGGGAAVAADRRAGRRRAATSPPPKAGRASWPTPSRSGRAARGHAEAPAAGRDRLAGGARRRRAGVALARRRGGRRPAGAGAGRPTPRPGRRRGAPIRQRRSRQPHDRVAWMLLLESAWWEALRRRRPRPALRPARLARRAVPLPRPRDRRARRGSRGRRCASGSPAEPWARRGAGLGRRRGSGDRAARSRTCRSSLAQLRDGRPEARGGTGSRARRLSANLARNA